MPEIRTKLPKQLARWADESVVAGLLKDCRHQYSKAMAASLIFGSMLSMVGPVIVACTVGFIKMTADEPFHFWSFFGITTAVMLPLLFLIAWAVQGSVVDAGLDGTDMDSLAGSMSQGRAFLGLIVLDIANIGPRLVIHGVRKWRRRKRIGSISVERLVQAITTIAVNGGSTRPAALFREEDPEGTLGCILQVLILYELVDVAKSGDRVWLTGPTKEKLGIVQ